jgi:hypothetical protein
MDERKELAKEVSLLPQQVSKFFSRERTERRRAAGAGPGPVGAPAKVKVKAKERVRVRVRVKREVKEEEEVEAECTSSSEEEEEGEVEALYLTSTTDSSIHEGALTLIQLSRSSNSPPNPPGSTLPTSASKIPATSLLWRSHLREVEEPTKFSYGARPAALLP